jgi:hypothetical protein
MASTAVVAQAQQIERIDVVEPGLYTASVVSAARNASGILQNTLNNTQLVQATREVPAKPGVRFGFRFAVVGEPKGTTVNVKKVIIFPAGGLQSPASKEPLTRSERTITRELDGEALYTGYSFDDPWELVPGTWTIELWHGDRKLTSQSFKVFKP